MSAVSSGGNYISDSQILSWLAEQQDRIYGELGENMDGADDRSDFVERLSKIKSDLHGAKSPDALKGVDAELQKFVEDYGSDPRFTSLMDGLDGIASKVHQDAQVHPDRPNDLTPANQFYKNNPSAKAPVNFRDPGFVDPTKPRDHDKPPAEPAFAGYSDDDLRVWDDLIGSKVDHANKNDQLTMIHIQELRSTLDQGSQLASSFISSGDKTSSSIINNIA
ncbi:MAG TPA: hypothetical protein VHB79_30685 [Polyangiaceae bacterium]|nr:hypothetical protein [Polyangiaceae bacterium]